MSQRTTIALFLTVVAIIIIAVATVVHDRAQQPNFEDQKVCESQPDHVYARLKFNHHYYCFHVVEGDAIWP